MNDQHDDNSANMPPEKPACSVETPTIADMLANEPEAMKEILRRPSDWTTRATGGGRRRRSLAVQPRREFCDRPRRLSCRCRVHVR